MNVLSVGSEGHTSQCHSSRPHQIRFASSPPPSSITRPSTLGMLPEEMIPMVAPLSPFNRIGTADEVAGVCVALVSEDCAWVCGQCIGVDGAGFL